MIDTIVMRAVDEFILLYYIPLAFLWSFGQSERVTLSPLLPAGRCLGHALFSWMLTYILQAVLLCPAGKTDGFWRVGQLTAVHWT